jgi:hypothetical protein
MSLILLQYQAPATTYGSLPILIAELSTGLWLLIVGIKVGDCHKYLAEAQQC